MNQVTIDPEIEKNSEWANDVKQATQWLEKELGGSSHGMTAEWRLIRHNDKYPGFLLKVADVYGGYAEAKFEPVELKRASHMKDRLHWLWGEVLRDYSRKQLQRVKEVVQQLEGD